MTDNHPKVSVILPTYNRRNTIVESVESVLNQTYEDFELLIIDDSSTDGSAELVKNLDSRIRYIVNEKNSGVTFTRNRGIALASYDLIAFQDSDDMWTPDKLEVQIGMLKDAPADTGMIYAPFTKITPKYTYTYPDASVPISDRSGWIFDFLLAKPLVGTPTMLIKKECLNDVGAFMEDLHCFEDYELSLRIAKKYRILCADHSLLNSIYSENSVNKNVEKRMDAQCYILREFFDDYMRLNILKIITSGIMSDAFACGKIPEATKQIQACITNWKEKNK